MDLAPPPSDVAPPPAPPGDPAPPPRIVGGVAGLLGERLGVDALWLRIAFVLLALVGGVGLLVYGALWLAFVVGADPERRWARLAGGAIVVVGLPLALTEGFRFADGPLAVLALLAGLAVALWQPRRAPHPVVPLGPPPAPRPAAAAEPAADRVDGAATRRRPVRPLRPPSILGRLTVGVAVLVAALGALIDEANGARLHPEQWLGAAAVVCALGLLLGAFAGRALWLVVPAALFAGVGFVAGEAARVGVRPTALVGDQYVYVGPGSPGDGVRRQHVVLGDVTVSIDPGATGPITVDARAGIGDVRVFAGDDVTVEVRATSDRGRVVVDGRGVDDGTHTMGPEGAPDVVVIARVGRGDVLVEQYDAAPAPLPDPLTPDPAAGQQFVADGVSLAAGGQFVLGEGEAVIDVDDTVLTGATIERDRVTVITTAYGDFQLLPGGLLLTPTGELLDLHRLRGDAAPTGPPQPDDVGATVPATTLPGG